MKRKAMISVMMACAALLCGCKSTGEAAPAASTTTAAATEAPAASTTPAGTTTAETSEEQEPSVGSDWRTWGIIDGYGTLDSESGEKIDICACVYSDRVELYYDKPEQVLFLKIDYPFSLTEEQYNGSAVAFKDVDGDGMNDVVITAETDGMLACSMTWLYDKGAYVYIDGLAYPPEINPNADLPENIWPVASMAGTWALEGNPDETLWILPGSTLYTGIYTRTAADGNVTRGVIELSPDEYPDGVVYWYSFIPSDGGFWEGIVLNNKAPMDLYFGQGGEPHYVRVLEGNAGEAPSEQTAAEKMNALSTIMGSMAGAPNIMTDTTDTISDDLGNVKFVKVTDVRFSTVSELEDYIKFTCSGTLRDSLLELCSERFTEKDGALYVDITNASGYPIFPLGEGLVLDDVTDTSFTATTVASDDLSGRYKASFIAEGKLWLIESYEIGVDE